MKLGDTIFNGNAFKNIILNSKSYKRLILGTNLVWSYFGIAIKAFRTRILADSGTYEAESILEDRLQEITPNLFDSASLVITPNGVKTSKLYSIKPNDGTGDLDVTRATTATRVNESGNIVDVPANVARIDYSTGQPAILSEPQRTNLVFPSDIATTQVRAVTAQVYTLSFYGTGSVVLSGAYSSTLNGTGANNRVSLTFTPTAGNLTLTVSGSVTNWQLEAGSNATSLIKTVSGSVTRNAELISKTGIIDLIGQTEGTIYCEFKRTTDTAGIKHLMTLYGDEFLTNSLFLITPNNGTSLNLDIRINSTLYGVNFGLLVEKNKLVLVYNTTKCDIFMNGSKLTGLSLPSFPSLYNLQIMNWNGFRQYGSGYLFSFWKTKLTDQQAIQLTTL